MVRADSPVFASFFRGMVLWTAVLASVAALATRTTHAAPLVLYTSNDLTTDASDFASDSIWLANQFNTFGYEAKIESVVLLLGTVPADLTAIRVDLYDSAAGVPGSQVATFTNPTAGSGEAYTFTLASPPTLVANSDYWIVLSMTGASVVEWLASTHLDTQGNSNPSNPLHFAPQSANWVNGTYAGQIAWGTPSIGPYKMGVYVQAVPEPSTYCMGLAGLGWVGLTTWRRRRRQGR